MSAIREIKGRQIVDSRGNPTVEAEVTLESGAVRDIYIERDASRGIVGNIYLGKVVRVMPIAAAVRFMRRAKAASDPSSAIPMAVAASLADFTAAARIR